MSLMIEFASFVGGAMSEYAQQKRWGSFKIFSVSFSAIFSMFTLCFLLYPPAKGLLFGVCGAAVLGLSIGIINVVLIRYSIRRKQQREHDRA